MKRLFKNREDLLSTLFVYFSIVTFSLLSTLFLIKNNVILYIISFLAVIYISSKKDIKKFPLLLFFISLIIRFIAVMFLDFPQVSDAKTLLKAAQGFANGDYSFSNLEYFKTWGYQTGFVIYEGLILKLISNTFILKVLNVIFSSFLTLFIYFAGKKIVSEKAARVSSLFYMIFPYHLFMNSILINHQLSTLLMYLGIFFILKDNKIIKDYIISALLIGLGNIIRPEGIIVVFSFILYEIFRIKKEKIFDTLKNIFIFLLVYILVGSVSSFMIQKLEINDQGLKNNNPLWKFVLGFNHDTCGSYTNDDISYLADNDKAIEIIKQRAFSKPLKTANLFVCKASNFWLQSDLYAKNNMYKSKTFDVFGLEIKFSDLLDVVIDFNAYLYLITLFMSIFGIFLNRKKIIKDKSLFFVILMTVTFFVYLLIEIQPRYAYFIHISVFILSTYGYDFFLNKFKIKKKNIFLNKIKSKNY